MFAFWYWGVGLTVLVSLPAPYVRFKQGFGGKIKKWKIKSQSPEETTRLMQCRLEIADASPLVAQCPDKFLQMEIFSTCEGGGKQLDTTKDQYLAWIPFNYENLHGMLIFVRPADTGDQSPLQKHRCSWQEDGNPHREQIIIVGLVLLNRTEGCQMRFID